MPLPDSPNLRQGRGHAPLRELPLYTVVAVAAAVLLVGLADDGGVGAGHPGIGAADRTAIPRGHGPSLESTAGDRDGSATPLVVPAGAARTPWRAAAPDDRSGGDPASDGKGPGATSPPGGGSSSALREFTGASTSRPELGRNGPIPRERGEYVAGVRQGEWETRWPDGTIRSQGHYEDGLREGAWQSYSAMGILIEYAEYDGGQLHGDWQIYADDGTPIGEGQHSENLRTGRWTLYFSDGQVKESGLYVGGLREGPWEFFDDLGQPTLRTGEYRAGIKIN